MQALSALPTGVDFDAYRAQLGNRAIVDEVERRLQALRPDTYDVGRQLKAIDAFEAEALRNAEETRETVRAQLKDLQKTMENIEQARPFDELTVDDMAKAEPSIDQRTEQLVVKGRWVVPGYKVGFRCVWADGGEGHTRSE